MKRLETNIKWCKSCGLCIAFCPKNILTMKDGKVFIDKPEDCVFCGTCESLCPDFAIFINEEDQNNG